MTVAHLRWMLCCLLCFVLLACHPAQHKEPSPEATRPSTGTVFRALPSDFATQPERVTAIPGRIRAVFADKLLRQEFVPKQGSKGLERLNMTPDLEEILRCYDVKRVWRSMAELEHYENGRVRVVSYAERVRERWKTQGMRGNARPYEVPDLSSAAAMLEMEFPLETNIDLLLKDLRKVPGVLSAEQIVVPIPEAPYFPVDPGWVDPSDPIYDATLARGRWGFHNTGAALGWDYLDGFDINLPEAWEYQRGNAAVTVAVLDNGVDVTHPDLYKNIYLNNGEVPSAIVMSYRNASTEDGLPDSLTFYDLNVPSVVDALSASGFRDTNGNGYIDGEDVVGWWSNGVDEDRNGYVDDLVGWDFVEGNNRPFDIGEGSHGTPVSGLIAAMADNRIGISGVAPRVRLMPIRTTMNVAEITYVLGFNSVKVINCSMSLPFRGTMIAEIIRTLEPEGVLFVASLGNRDAYYFGSDPSQREEIMSISNFSPQG
ncbi:MAG: Thermophilic serine proteinase precursor, partial [Bacteroidetes bacterium]|nr:Thermophilic serine proteinase precursor [Bacteroidota bacterium]